MPLPVFLWVVPFHILSLFRSAGICLRYTVFQEFIQIYVGVFDFGRKHSTASISKYTHITRFGVLNIL